MQALRPNLGSYPDLAGEALAHWASRHGSSREKAEKWRLVGRRACLGLQFGTYYLTTVAELIYFEQFFGQVRYTRK